MVLYSKARIRMCFAVFMLSIACSVDALDVRETPVENNGEGLGLVGGITNQEANLVAAMIRGNGYSCKSISNMRRFLSGKGYSVACNNFRYEYEVEDVGGNWVVQVN